MFGFPKMFPSSMGCLLMTIPVIDMNRYVGDISDISDMLGVSFSTQFSYDEIPLDLDSCSLISRHLQKQRPAIAVGYPFVDVNNVQTS